MKGDKKIEENCFFFIFFLRMAKNGLFNFTVRLILKGSGGVGVGGSAPWALAGCKQMRKLVVVGGGGGKGGGWWFNPYVLYHFTDGLQECLLVFTRCQKV